MPATSTNHTTRKQKRTLSAREQPERNIFTPDRVTDIQRARMLAAMAAVACEHGAASVTVAHVVHHAGVSRRTFYEIFTDIEDCLLAAIDDAYARVRRLMLDTYDPHARWVDRIRKSLVALLVHIDEEPFCGRLLIVESLAAGPDALQRRQAMLAQLIAAVDEGRAEAPKGAEPPPLTAEGVIGGVLSVLHARLSQPGSARMVELAGSLMGMIVLPYLGAAAAHSELARQPPEPSIQMVSGRPLSRLDMRLTYRTVRVLVAVAAHPGASNRKVAEASGVTDQGQMSKLLARLCQLGLIENMTGTAGRGEPNAWTLTSAGWDLQSALAQPSSA